MKEVASEQPTASHPGRADRLQAIAAGWKNAASGQAPRPGGTAATGASNTTVASAEPVRRGPTHAASARASAQACATRSGMSYCVSSYLPTGGVNRSNYGPSSLIDGDSKSAWVEGRTGKTDDGIGEWVLIEWGNERRLRGLRIHNGYPKSRRHFRINGRVGRVRVTLSTGRNFEFNLNDTSSPQTLQLPSSEPATWVRVQIVRAIRGTKYADTAINEIRPLF